MNHSEMKARLADMIVERTFRYRDNPPFTLASGKQSTFYFNCKPTTLDPEGMNLIGNIIFDMIEDSGISAVGGLTLGADPIANAVAVISYQRNHPVKSFIVRKDVKGHGTRSAIEGNVQEGERVAVLDDVITTGGSTVIAVEKAQEAGLIVDRVITLIDREEENGRENILQSVQRVESIFTRTDIMSLYEQKGMNKS